jgi:hypothetical protein
MHVNNHLKGKKKSLSNNNLICVIDELKQIFPLSQNEIDKIQEGRKFLNKVKHHKTDETSWKSNIVIFEEAYSILEKHKIVIF